MLIGDYDPRVQSAHCKRIAGFVPHEPLPLDERRFRSLHRLSSGAVERRPRRAQARTRVSCCERLEGMHEALSRIRLIGALVGVAASCSCSTGRSRVYAAQILRRRRSARASFDARAALRSADGFRVTARAFAGIRAAGAALRLRAVDRCVLVRVVRSLVVGSLRPHGVAGPLFFCSLLGIVVALDAELPGAIRISISASRARRSSDANSHAQRRLVPCIAATLATLAYVAGTQFAARFARWAR